MEPDRISDSCPHTLAPIVTTANRCSAPQMLRRAAGLLWLALALGFFAGAAVLRAHWISGDEIVVRLQQDAALRGSAGVRSVRREGRILVITVDQNTWRRLPQADRLRLANSWQQLWAHNVAEGIVAVVSSEGEQPLVNYNGRGEARLIGP